MRYFACLALGLLGTPFCQAGIYDPPGIPGHDYVFDSFVVNQVEDGRTMYAKRNNIRPGKVILPIEVMPMDHPLGREARNRLAALVEGKQVSAQCFDIMMGDTCSVMTANGETVYVELIKAGLARTQKRRQYPQAVIDEQNRAKAQKLGIWAVQKEEQKKPVSNAAGAGPKPGQAKASPQKAQAAAAEKPNRPRVCRSGNFFVDLFGQCERVMKERQQQGAAAAPDQRAVAVAKDDRPQDDPKDKGLVDKAVDRSAAMAGEKIGEKVREEIVKSTMESIRKKVLGF